MDSLIRGVNSIYWDNTFLSTDIGPKNELPALDVAGELVIECPIAIDGDLPSATIRHHLSGPTHPEDIIRLIYNFYNRPLTFGEAVIYKQKQKNRRITEGKYIDWDLEPGYPLYGVITGAHIPTGPGWAHYYELLGLARSENGYRLLFSFDKKDKEIIRKQGLAPY